MLAMSSSQMSSELTSLKALFIAFILMVPVVVFYSVKIAGVLRSTPLGQ